MRAGRVPGSLRAAYDRMDHGCRGSTHPSWGMSPGVEAPKFRNLPENHGSKNDKNTAPTSTLPSPKTCRTDSCWEDCVEARQGWSAHLCYAKKDSGGQMTRHSRTIPWARLRAGKSLRFGPHWCTAWLQAHPDVRGADVQVISPPPLGQIEFPLGKIARGKWWWLPEAEHRYRASGGPGEGL